MALPNERVDVRLTVGNLERIGNELGAIIALAESKVFTQRRRISSRMILSVSRAGFEAKLKGITTAKVVQHGHKQK
jgi:hypothetical protein